MHFTLPLRSARTSSPQGHSHGGLAGHLFGRFRNWSGAKSLARDHSGEEQLASHERDQQN
jgi:hypothetical protein